MSPAYRCKSHTTTPSTRTNHAEQMVDVRLALTAIGGVQPGREPQCPFHLPLGGRIGELGCLQCEPLP